MRKMFAFLAAAAALSFAAPAAAAVTLTTDPTTHKLTAASGIDVNGVLYDVTFVNPTDNVPFCTTVYGTCDAAHVSFASYTDAYAAANALLNTVFATEPYDSHPENVNGCVSTIGCETYISYANNGTPYILGVYNFAPGANGFDGIGSAFTLNTDRFLSSSQMLAVFTRQAAPVPEPATWAMMLLGFGGIGFAMRRQRKALVPA